jgi:protein-S-isoprenylcysteine O-methyltransferase Ste14
MNDNFQDNAGVIAPPPLIFAAILAVGLLLQRFFPKKFLPRRAGIIPGAMSIGFALVLVQRGYIAMRNAHTNIDPREPATTVVTDGPYRYTRNPLYLSLMLVYTGIAFLANALWVILLLPVLLLVMIYGVIVREERYLERKFGEQYLSYKARVRRWF